MYSEVRKPGLKKKGPDTATKPGVEREIVGKEVLQKLAKGDFCDFILLATGRAVIVYGTEAVATVQA